MARPPRPFVSTNSSDHVDYADNVNITTQTLGDVTCSKMASFIKGVFGPSTVLMDLDSVTCPICLEIYVKPKQISCGHVFCSGCLTNYDTIVEPQCPLCRKVFNPLSAVKATDKERLLRSSKAICVGCNAKFLLGKLQSHQTTCEKFKCCATSMTEKVALAQRKESLKELPNRHTFKCPFCGLLNLDRHGLQKHVNESHDSNRAKVVCPICASMPWGDPEQKSSNFVAHLNFRHRFEYDTLVDYELDDSAALEKALKASLEEQ